MHYARPGEITIALAEACVCAQLREPSSAPGPVAKQWICDGTHDDRSDSKGGKFPPLSAGACHDCEGRVHEHHFEQEDDHHTNVVSVPCQKIS